MTGEWSLILFTLLTQMAVGAFLLMGIVHIRTRRRKGLGVGGPGEGGLIQADNMNDRALLAIGPVLLAALACSLFHLGYPLNFYNALNNLGSSWLSREVLLFILFAGVGGAFALLQWRKKGAAPFRLALAFLAALLGLGLIYCMSRVYLLRTVPPWNHWSTPAGFYITALFLGAVALGTAYVIDHTGLTRETLRFLAGFAVFFLALKFLVVFFRIVRLAGGGPAAEESLSRLMGDLGPVLLLHLLLAFLGVAIFSLFLIKGGRGEGGKGLRPSMACTALVLVLISEVLGRYLFFATYVRTGL